MPASALVELPLAPITEDTITVTPTPQRRTDPGRTDQVRTFLEGLGGTADEVAVSLRKLGAVGFREHPRECPIAMALWQRFRDAVNVHVFGDSACVTFQIGSVTVLHTAAVMNFIHAVDRLGAYPDIARPYRVRHVPIDEVNSLTLAGIRIV